MVHLDRNVDEIESAVVVDDGGDVQYNIHFLTFALVTRTAVLEMERALLLDTSMGLGAPTTFRNQKFTTPRPLTSTTALKMESVLLMDTALGDATKSM